MTSRRVLARALGALMLALLLGGCSQQPKASVTIYGQNAGAGDAWFAIVPLADPPQAVGFGADGVACLGAPVGSDVARFDGTPGLGGKAVQKIGPVVGADGVDANVYWVSVAADGNLTTGRGVPDWWVGDPQAC